MDQETQFIADYLRYSLAITELCEHYGISRKSGYNGLNATRARVPPAWPSAPGAHVCPTQTPEEVVQALIETRERHPSWGAKKLLALLSQRHPDGAPSGAASGRVAPTPPIDPSPVQDHTSPPTQLLDPQPETQL